VGPARSSTASGSLRGLEGRLPTVEMNGEPAMAAMAATLYDWLLFLHLLAR
jgi:hypothetical protein